MKKNGRSFAGNERKVRVFIPVLLVFFFFLPRLKTEASNRGIDGKKDDQVYMFVGSYAAAEDPGLYVYSYDAGNLEFEEMQRVSGLANPSFFAFHPSGKFLYVVNEIADFKGKEEGAVAAFRFHRQSGKLEFLNKTSSMGGTPCQITVFPDGRHVLVANYSGGSLAALPVARDGSLKPAEEVVQHQGSGPNKRRQEKAHAHSVYTLSGGSYIFSADLGIDKVMIYQPEKGRLLAPNTASPFAKLKPGAGPRHMAFHPENRSVYVINELNSTITRLEFYKESGKVTVLESLSTLPPGWEGENYCADIHIHPSGKFLYASNRGHNSIAIFEIMRGGRLNPKGHEGVRGKWPRNFSIDPRGNRLIVANQQSDNIVVFDIDPETGELHFTGKELQVRRPVCIKFLSP